MIWITHLLAALVLLLYFNPDFWFCMFFLIFTLLPDIDSSKSIIGKKLYPLSRPIELLFGHRGIFHGILIPIIFSLIFLAYGLNMIALAAFSGYLLHLMLDAITLSGINILGFKTKGFVKTDGILEFCFDLILITIIIYLI